MADINPESNDTPEIPSFKPTRKPADEEKGAAGSLSGLGKGKPSPLSSLGKPSAVGTKGSLPSTGGGGFKFPGFGGGKQGPGGMKIRGMSGAGGSLLDRIKNLRRKDLMFIGAGLATLMMAPVAEHFMMTPDDRSSGGLEEGFDSKGPLFPDGSTVYEGGTGGFSPGNQIGMGTDVITPLNVRDPSALVMGPGARQKAEAVVESPPPATTSSDDDGSASKWKDALAESAKSGVKEAVKRTPKLPTPSIKMQGALRGLSALSGGGSGTKAQMQLAKLDASNVPNRARGSNSLTTSQAAPGFRGAARRSNAAGSGIEGLRAAAGGQADIFSRAGASDGLQTAANVALPFPGGGGYGGFGGPGGDSGPGKNGGGNQIKENKQLGESLEFLRRKMEQEKAIGLKWKKKEWNQFGRKKAIEEGAIKLMFDSFGKIIVDPIAEMGKTLAKQFVEPSGAAAGGVYCNAGSPSRSLTNPSGHFWQCKSRDVAQLIKSDSHAAVREQDCLACAGFDGSTDPKHEPENPNVDGPGKNPWEQPLGNSDPANSPRGNIFQICEDIKKISKTVAGDDFTTVRALFLSDAQRLVVARMNLNSDKGTGAECLKDSAITKTDYVKDADETKSFTTNDFSDLVNGIQGDLFNTHRQLWGKYKAGASLATKEAGVVDGAKQGITKVASDPAPTDTPTTEAAITSIKELVKGPKDGEFAKLGERVKTELDGIRGDKKLDASHGGTAQEIETPSLDKIQANIAATKEEHQKIHAAMVEMGRSTLAPLKPGYANTGIPDAGKAVLQEYEQALRAEHTALTNQWNAAVGRSTMMDPIHDKAESARQQEIKAFDLLASKASETAVPQTADAGTKAEALKVTTYVTTVNGAEQFNATQWQTDTTAVTTPLETAAKSISTEVKPEFDAAKTKILDIHVGHTGHGHQ